MAERGQGWQGSKTQAYWLVVRVLLTPPAEAAANQKWEIIYLQVLRLNRQFFQAGISHLPQFGSAVMTFILLRIWDLPFTPHRNTPACHKSNNNKFPSQFQESFGRFSMPCHKKQQETEHIRQKPAFSRRFSLFPLISRELRVFY